MPGIEVRPQSPRILALPDADSRRAPYVQALELTPVCIGFTQGGHRPLLRGSGGVVKEGNPDSALDLDFPP